MVAVSPFGQSRQSDARRSGHYWPNAEQVLLLRAALLNGEAALAASERWRGSIDLDRLDAGSERLLPLLVHNLQRCGISDPHLARFKGLLHYVWVANQFRMVQIAPAIDALRGAQIPTMLLKGMALARGYYQNMGLRPMDDVDLLVPTSDARRAMDIVRTLGWRSAGPEPDLSTTYACSFVNESGCQIDLHWHALWESCGPDSDDDLWARATPAQFADTPIWILAPEDLFLHVVVHGARWNAVPPLRWVADAMTILSTSNRAFEWTRLVAQARKHALILPVREALVFLAETFDAPIPACVLAELDAHRTSTFERIEQRMRAWTSPSVGCFPVVLCHHVRVTRAAGPLAVVWRLPRYLQQTYGLHTLRALPAALWVRAARRLRAAASRVS